MININKTKEFLLKSFKNDLGGFSASLLLPPTLEDTFYGVKALYKIDKNLIDTYKKKIIDFTEAYTEQEELPVEHIAKIIEIYEILSYRTKEIDKKMKKLTTYIYNKSENFETTSIYRLYCLWKISKYLNLTKMFKVLKKVSKYITPNNNEEIYYLGLVDKIIWNKYINFVIKSQNGDGGFGFYPGTTSYLENTYFAMKMISSIYPDEEQIISKGRNFVIACYNGDGGFARKPGGISYLNTTYYGVDLVF